MAVVTLGLAAVLVHFALAEVLRRLWAGGRDDEAVRSQELVDEVQAVADRRIFIDCRDFSWAAHVVAKTILLDRRVGLPSEALDDRPAERFRICLATAAGGLAALLLAGAVGD